MTINFKADSKQTSGNRDIFQKTQVILYLEKHPQISPFLIIDSSGISPNKKSFSSYRDTVHRQNLKKLKNLKETKNSTFLTQPDLPQITKPQYMRHHISFMYHEIQFLFYKFNFYHQKVNINFKDYVSVLIELFELIITNNSNQIEVLNVDFDYLVSFLHKVPDKMKRVRLYYLQYIQDFSKELKKNTKSTADLRKDFLETLQQTKSMVDSSLNFFNPTSLQEEFEYIVFSPNFGVLDFLNQIIDKETFNKLTPSELVQKIIKLNNQIIQIHKLKKEDNTSLIITFLFRIIFNEVYPMIKLFYLPEFSFDLLLKLKDLTLKDINVPLEYCPAEFSSEKYMNDFPRNTFRNDPNYSLASIHIEYISFFTNPLDILHQISAALHEIEKAAMIYKLENASRLKKKTKNDEGANDINDNNDSVADDNFNIQPVREELSEFLFPFEVTFALFISTILASDVPEFMRIAAFTDKYSPTFGLCASFEFSLAKLKTVSIYMQNLAQQMIEKEAKLKASKNENYNKTGATKNTDIV